MNPGPVEEVGKVSMGIVDSLKSQPLSLALVIMNLALLVFVFFQNAGFNQQRKENAQLFAQMQTEVQKLLSQCVVPK